MHNVPIRVLAKQERFMSQFIKNNAFYVEQFFEFVIDSIGVICRFGVAIMSFVPLVLGSRKRSWSHKLKQKPNQSVRYENSSAFRKTLTTDKVSHHTYKSLLQPVMERTICVAGVSNCVNFEGASLDRYRTVNDVKTV